MRTTKVIDPLSNRRRHIGRFTARATGRTVCYAMLLLCAIIANSAFAQNGEAGDEIERDPVTNRRITDGDPVVLNFQNVRVSDTIEFIVATSGKTVIPRSTVLTLPVTVVNDVPLPRDEALNRLFIAFLDHDIGVVETEDLIKIDQVSEIAKDDCPVVGANESLIGRRDEGVIINKIFQLRYAIAEDVASVLDEMIPDTWAAVEVEPGSNSIVALCSVGLGKKLEKTVRELDRSPIGETRTILLNYASATDIADKVMQMYGPGDSSSRSQRAGDQANRGGDPRQRFQPGGGGGTTSPSSGAGAPTGGVLELRAVADERNNSVTIAGEPSLLDQIESQIRNEWDRQLIDPDQVIRTYELKYRDVVVLRDLLNELSGQSISSGAQRQGTRVTQDAAGGGSSGGAGGRISDLFQFQADPSANELIAIAKTPSAFEFLDKLIAQFDSPNEAERPLVIPLKHADAFELAQEINTVFARSGVRTANQAREEGLQEFDIQSRFDEGGGGGGGGTQEPQGQEVLFPWQLEQDDPNIAPISPLIGRFRVMPVERQNAVLILGPPHYKDYVASIIQQLDKPGRQVLITGIIAEVELDDALSLGLRFSSGPISNTASENVLSASGGVNATENEIFGGLFDTSVLDVNTNLNVVLEALKSKTQVRILSEPRIFTHDNEQANFFDGQDVQFVQESISDLQTGNLNQSFEFRKVGIVLSVRPRITVNRDIDLLVDLELSSLVPNQATPAGGLIIDLRRTQTRVIVEDRQTIVISGILREQQSQVVRKVPFFGDIPLIGALFSSTSQNSTVSELVAFITPIVVDNPSENDALNEPMRDRLDDLERPLEEQMDDFGDASQIWGRHFNPDSSGVEQEQQGTTDTAEQSAEEGAADEGIEDVEDDDDAAEDGE